MLNQLVGRSPACSRLIARLIEWFAVHLAQLSGVLS